MAGRVRRWNDGDVTCLRIGDDFVEIGAAIDGLVIRLFAIRSSGFNAPGLIIGEMKIERVELVERNQIDDRLDLVRGEIMPGNIEMETAPFVMRTVHDADSRNFDAAGILLRRSGEKLQQRGQAHG